MNHTEEKILSSDEVRDVLIDISAPSLYQMCLWNATSKVCHHLTVAVLCRNKDNSVTLLNTSRKMNTVRTPFFTGCILQSKMHYIQKQFLYILSSTSAVSKLL
ncbi:hypothetical protein L798_09124 [Zootermopsis nevadensis]|uniref:Uncharacterized protein n=1 Tax=Zootermopsis nevadensis TaxID=136037 RepID=A0A067RBA3_ZOONE|nr:hypothetical protein L798_09124 [Zootermopsis nevadensis]